MSFGLLHMRGGRQHIGMPLSSPPMGLFGPLNSIKIVVTGASIHSDTLAYAQTGEATMQQGRL